VSQAPPATPHQETLMATYATQDDLLAYVPGLQINDPARAEALLLRAEREVDDLVAWPGYYGATVSVFALWPRYRDPTTGLRLHPTDLEAWQAAALNRAVCAQWEYHVAMGEDFFLRPQPAAVQQPEGGGYQGRLPMIGPKVYVELAGTDLLRLTGSAATSRDRDPLGFQRAY
jgi:hypothetical protein